MNKINLLEVYYNLCRAYGENRADDFVKEINESFIIINHNITDDIFKTAGKLKAEYKVSLADSIALAQAVVINGTLITSDHHEFDVI